MSLSPSRETVTRVPSVSLTAPNVPSVQNFLRRAFHSSVAVGNFIYIDGGEVLQLPTDNGDPMGKLGLFCLMTTHQRRLSRVNH